jgi:hypothetical protein
MHCRIGENPPYGMRGGSRKRRHHSKPATRLDPTRPVGRPEPDLPFGDALALTIPAARGCASSPRCRHALAGTGRSQPWPEQQLEDLNARRHAALVPSDADQDLDRDSGMAARQSADVDGSTWQMSLALKAWRRPIAWVRCAVVDGNKKPATGVPARASDCCDGENMPVICPTCQLFSRASSHSSNWPMTPCRRDTRSLGQVVRGFLKILLLPFCSNRSIGDSSRSR